MKRTFCKILTLSAFAAGLIFSSCASTEKSSKNNSDKTDKTIVQTDAGKIRGAITENGVYSFKGVQYATAKERFVPASPVEKWDGIKDATQYGKISSQMGFGNTSFVSDDISSNDCQNLNIWTPATDNKKRAVMVWLHGGGFSSGSAQESPSYDGANLAKSGDVVVVSVNHRLNILGFFDLSSYGEKYKYSGNAGIQDIIDSLSWIQKNISAFGGNPKNVTVFGESGGGAKVLALMTTPRAKGLFSKGIVESGSTVTMGVVFTKKNVAQYVTEETLKELGITKDNIEEIQKVPFKTLLTAGEEVLARAAKELGVDGAFGPGTALMWEPVVDGDFMPSDPVTENGFAEMGKGIPLLIGTNINEWTAFPILNDAESNLKKLESYSEDEIKAQAEKTYGKNGAQIVDEYKNAYPDEPLYNSLYIETLIRLPILKTTIHKAAQNAGNVYSYIFTYGSPFSYHGSEIAYVFNNPKTNGIPDVVKSDGSDEKVAKLMSDVWVAFAKTGNPSTSATGKWEAYTKENGSAMFLGEKCKLVHHHDEKLLNLLAPDYV